MKKKMPSVDELVALVAGLPQQIRTVTRLAPTPVWSEPTTTWSAEQERVLRPKVYLP